MGTSDVDISENQTYKIDLSVNGTQNPYTWNVSFDASFDNTLYFTDYSFVRSNSGEIAEIRF